LHDAASFIEVKHDAVTDIFLFCGRRIGEKDIKRVDVRIIGKVHGRTLPEQAKGRNEPRP
jgi:hypothetical protein